MFRPFPDWIPESIQKEKEKGKRKRGKEAMAKKGSKWYVVCALVGLFTRYVESGR